MRRQSSIVLILGLGLIAAGAAVLSRLHALQRLGAPGVRIVSQPVHGENGKIVGTNTVDLPVHVLGYDSEEVAQPDVVINWLPPDTTIGQRMYRATNQPPMQLAAVVMGTDRTSLHKPEYCLRGQGFGIERIDKTAIQIEKPHRYELPVTRMTCSKEETAADGTKTSLRGIFIFWFVADGQLTGDHNQRMKWMARDLIFHQVLQRWAYVSCFAVCQPGQEDLLFAKMQEFIAAAVPQFQLAAGPPELKTASR